MVSFRWRTTALGYRRRKVVVGFKRKPLVVSGLLQVNSRNGRLQIKNGCGFPRRMTVVSFRWRTTTALGCRRRTTVIGFKWRALVVSGLLQVINYNDWLQMENSGGLCTENDSSELHIE